MLITLTTFRMIAEQRQVGETALNDTSSRSHQIIRLVRVLFALSHSRKNMVREVLIFCGVYLYPDSREQAP